MLLLRLRGPAALRGLAALPCLVLVGLLLRVGTAPLCDSARDWIDRGSAAAAEYRRASERFAATDVRLLQLDARTLRGEARALTASLLAEPDVVEVVSASQLQPDWEDLPEHVLPYGCDSTGECYHIDDLRWAEARALHGPLSERLKLLDLEQHRARLLVLSRSRAVPVPEISLQHAALADALPWLLLLASCLVAGLRRSWRLGVSAILPAALASAASRAVLLPLGWTASIAEPTAEVACFALVLAAALHVSSRERAVAWLSGAENPWRVGCVGAGESARALVALALASASLMLIPIPGLRSFALQCAFGLLIGAALASTLSPTLAALLPRQTAPAAPSERQYPAR